MPDHAKSTLTSMESSRAERLMAVLEVVQKVNSVGFDVDKTYAQTVENIKLHLGYPLVSIFMVDEVGEHAFLRAFNGQTEDQLKISAFSLSKHSKSNTSACLQKGKLSASNKVHFLEGDPRIHFHQGLKACVDLPLFSEKRMIGILEIFSNSADAFDLAEMEILSLLANQISTVLKNAIDQSAVRRTVNGYRNIQSITTDLGQAPAYEDLIQRSLQLLSTHIRDGRIAFLTVENNGSMRIRAYTGYADTESDTLHLKPGGGAAGLAARQLKPLCLTDKSDNEEMQGLSPLSRSILAVPAHYDGKLLGVLNIESDHVNAFSEDDFEIVSALANSLASILSNLEYVEQIKQQTERQKQLYEITNKIRQSVDVNTIMRTSIEEICTNLNLSKATIHVNQINLSSNTDPQTERPL